MALDTNATMLKNLIDPEVIAAFVDAKLIDAIKFAPLATVDATLQNQAGSTISVPVYSYIGDSVEVLEGHDIPIRQLTQTSKPYKVKKIGVGGQITDEAILSGLGNPVQEYASQFVKSIASKIDNDLLAELGKNEKTYLNASGATLTPDDIATALTGFGEDIDGEKVIMVTPAFYATLRKASNWLPASQMSAEIIVKGAVGEIYGCQVVVTNRIKDERAYIVKPGALRVFLKRDMMVETDRDIVNKSTVLTADKHYIAALYDDSKAITIAPTGSPVVPTPPSNGEQS